MSYLLDTNILSEIRKARPDERVLTWFDAVPAPELYISVMAIGEIRRGVELLRHRGDTHQAEHLAAWLAGLEMAYEDRIIPITGAIAERWGRLNVPDPLPVVAGLLAATALVHTWTLVTRDTGQIARTGVRLLNPFDPPPPA